MAQDNIEVEIKTKIGKKKFESLKLKLKRISKFKDKIHHIDTYYNSPTKNFLKPKYPYEWLSVRDRGEKLTLNYKHWYPPGKKNTTHCDEYEIVFDSIEQIEKILKALDFKKLITVDKTRWTFIHNNEIEIALDEVKGLGYFIEVEALRNKGDLKQTYNNLEEFLKSLGIKDTTIIPGGYAAEMLRRKGLMKI
ncbi:class IV adenylate cyclase [Candidatus Woesebacteria bacterium]|nr:class IV adenylate cyclase [Candidatus Woesebacteria bacterium]